MLKRICSLLAIALLVAGCATVGEEFDIAAVDKLEPGVATIDDAVALLGPYSTQAVNSNGAKAYGWSFAHANGFTGKSQAKAVTLVFGPDGKLAKKGTSQNKVKTGS